MRIKIFALVSFLFLLAFATTPIAFAEDNSDTYLVSHADFYDIFLMSWEPVSVDDPDVQWFAERLHPVSKLYRKADSAGVRTYIFLNPFKFGCIAKDNLPGGKKMHVENCEVRRQVYDGMADTNYTHHIVLDSNDNIVKEFNSTITWSFNLVPDEDSYIWLVGRSTINDTGPDLVEFFCVEGEGIVGKRQAYVSW